MTIYRLVVLGLILLMGCGEEQGSSPAMVDDMGMDAAGSDAGITMDSAQPLDLGQPDATVTPPDMSLEGAQISLDGAADEGIDVGMDAEADLSIFE